MAVFIDIISVAIVVVYSYFSILNTSACIMTISLYPCENQYTFHTGKYV